MRIFRGSHGKLPGFVLVFGVLVLISFGTQTVKADPLMFSNTRVFQNNNFTQVDLFSSPGSIIDGPYLTFRVDVTGTLPPGGGDFLQLTYTEAGAAPQVKTYQIPAFGSVYPPLTMFFSFESPGANRQGVPAALTIDLLSSAPDFVVPFGADAGQLRDSYTYSFNVVQPVPEPATLLAFGTGLAFIARRRRKMKQD